MIIVLQCYNNNVSKDVYPPRKSKLFLAIFFPNVSFYPFLRNEALAAAVL